MATGYEPLDTPKPIARDIWLIDGPAIRFYGMPYSTRATIVRLGDGGLWVHSPTRLTDALKAQVSALGPVRHLIAPNWIHYAYVADWQAAFPEAQTWAAPGVAERAEKRGRSIRWDHALEQDAPSAWAADIAQLVVRGSAVHREAVFFHKQSRTLILTDLIENFEGGKLPLWMRWATRLAGIADPHGAMPRDMRQTFRKGRAALRDDITRMIEWGPERIILSHGRWFETGGTAELKRAFRWVLT